MRTIQTTPAQFRTKRVTLSRQISFCAEASAWHEDRRCTMKSQIGARMKIVGQHQRWHWRRRDNPASIVVRDGLQVSSTDELLHCHAVLSDGSDLVSSMAAGSASTWKQARERTARCGGWVAIVDDFFQRLEPTARRKSLRLVGMLNRCSRRWSIRGAVS